MKRIAFLLVVLSVITGSILLSRAPFTSAQTEAQTKREALYRLNNLGVALMEQFKHEEAVKRFKEALAADPKFALARINLATAHLFLNEYANAINEAREALKLAPASLNAQYVLASALRNEKQYDPAIEGFKAVLAADAADTGANIQLGQLYSQKQQYDPAIAAFRRALAAEPYNATAAYSLAQALNRSGKTDEGAKMLALFQKLRASGYATTLGNVYGERGKYAEAVVSTGAETDLVNKEGAQVKFVEMKAGVEVKTAAKPLLAALGRTIEKAAFNDALKRELVAPFSASVMLADYDGDARPDLFASGTDDSGKPFIKLLHNDGGKFSDVTATSKLTTTNPVSGAVFGDFDNDGKTDIATFGYQTLMLWKNNGDGSFANVTEAAKLPTDYKDWALTAAWVDVDHDGDLDLYLGNFADLAQFPDKPSAVFPDDFAGAENKLFRNNGNGTFTDITAQASVGGGGRNKTTAIVCTDFNNGRDIDLLVVNYAAPAQLFSNQRDGSFKDVAAQVGLKIANCAFGVGAGDVNKDGFIDFYFPEARPTELGASDFRMPTLMLSNGRGGFVIKPDGPLQGRVPSGLAAQIFDYDNDGLLDILMTSFSSLIATRNTGSYQVLPWTNAVDDKMRLDARAFASADIDGDGAIDLAAFDQSGTLIALRNEGAGKNFARVQLAGKTSNRSAIGAKAEMRAGSLTQKLEVYGSSPAPAPSTLVFGLGYRTAVDALQLLWPAGILQSEVAVKAGAANAIDELDRKGTSCPILYAWNGERYDFVTDFLGGSAIGAREPSNVWSTPDTDEYVRVTSDQLKERDGKLSLLMNNQLEEAIYFDAAKLLAVDHPADVEVYPNERLLPAPPYPDFKLYATRDARPPVKAIDDAGRDIRPLIEAVDRRYPDQFELLRFKGYAREHAITLDLGDVRDAKRVLLLLTAWIDYADSTSNLAASQAGVTLTPPYVQVRDARGQWQTVMDQMGFPAGLPKTMTVDLTDALRCEPEQNASAQPWVRPRPRGLLASRRMIKKRADSQVAREGAGVPRLDLSHVEIRIVTSMRIYWDQILVDSSGGNFPTRVTRLDAASADLHWRGFPREYSPDGRRPMIYDYSIIEPIAPWKAHLGNYTRFGDVRELLTAVDDRYVITRNGDEIALDFDATRLPKLPAGWRRTYLIYAEGFGKDMDWNSARPDTIGELPFHRMKSYPPTSGESYPTDQLHQEYLRRYNTRTVNEQLRAAWQAVR